MTDMLTQEIGKEGKLELKVEAGKVKMKVGVDTKGVDAAVEVAIDVPYFLEKLKAAIPGQVDDAIIGGLQAMLMGATA